eukprot:Hpha_TRINITY_DN290_c0_g1::TRINITY_DN290_c0_g1_i1::g.83574::m.83574
MVEQRRISRNELMEQQEPALPVTEGGTAYHTERVPAGQFYEPYHGHPPDRLRSIEQSLRSRPDGAERRCVFLAGDSSLDNKHWLFPGCQSASAVDRDRGESGFTHTAVNGYEHVLYPPRMVGDVCYWMNQMLGEKGDDDAFVLNTAVEASLLATRVGGCFACVGCACPSLWEQDKIIRDRIQPQDILVVSVGGNDIALAPSIFTIIFILLMMITPWFLLAPFHPSILYFVMMFNCQVRCYVNRLTSKCKPEKVAVCMIYNLDEKNTSSWANAALCALCYTCAPRMLQLRLRYVYALATAQMCIPGVEVVPVHLAEAMNGKDTNDYIDRVEPSEQGGRKMAKLILHKLGLVRADPEPEPYACPWAPW